MKLILLCLVATVFAKPKGPIKLADAAKDVAEKETEREAMAGHGTDDTCKDHIQGGTYCGEMKSAEKCNDQIVRKSCAKTCGTCPSATEYIPGTKAVFNLEGRKLTLIEAPGIINWASARQSCKNYGGDLASPLTDAELGIIAQYEPESAIMPWLGAQLVDVKDPKKGWKWITGETLPADSEKWYSAEDRDDGNGCLYIWLKKGAWDHGKIFSSKCTDSSDPTYICQFK